MKSMRKTRRRHRDRKTIKGGNNVNHSPTINTSDATETTLNVPLIVPKTRKQQLQNELAKLREADPEGFNRRQRLLTRNHETARVYAANVARREARREAEREAKAKANMEAKAKPKRSLWNSFFGINYT